MSKVIWQKATSPTLPCHPSRLPVDSSDLDVISYMVSWTAHESSPNGISIGSAVVFVQLTRSPNTETYRQTDRQTTLRATSVAIGRILCTACRRCGLRWGENSWRSVVMCVERVFVPVFSKGERA